MEMKELKFRAWHKEQKKMYSAEEMGQDQLTLMTDGRGFANISGVDTKLSRIDDGRTMIPLQYTGLKDSYAKEEYFGDIIREEDGTIRIIEDGCSAVLFRNPQVTFDIKYFWELKQHEVIGNIYENPEIMEAK